MAPRRNENRVYADTLTTSDGPIGETIGRMMAATMLAIFAGALFFMAIV